MDVTLVIGGTGQLGRAIVSSLLGQGGQVRVLARRAPTRGFPSPVMVLTGDITQEAQVGAALSGVARCVIAVESATDPASPNAPQRVHFEGLRHVVAHAAPGTHIVLISQIYITRATEHPDIADIIHWRAAAEQYLRESGFPYTILRPSWLTNAAAGQAAIHLEQGDRGEGQVARPDVATVVAQACAIPAARGVTCELYNRSGPLVTDWPASFAALQPDRPPAGAS